MSLRGLTLALPLTLLAIPAEAQVIDHSQHGAAAPAATAAEEQVGDAPPPPVATDYAADRIFPLDRMEPARAALLAEGRFRTTTLRIDRLEYRALDGRDGYAFEGEVWTGGDIDRFVLDIAAEGEFGHDPESLEASALWRHAIDPFFNLELGVRQDFQPTPQRTYAVAGISGLAPYWVEVQGHVFLSDQGDAHVWFEAEHDMRITQKLILQPAVEVDFALQDVPELGIGSGFETLELGARLRYQLGRTFAPYVGVHWERKLGRTADFARDQGDHASSLAVLFGIRTWF